MELNKDFFSKLMQKLAKEKHIFSNEAQFQFNLAVAIERELSNYKEKLDYEVLLEEQINKKEYTDIVVLIGEDYYPIELKYKTADREVLYTYKDRKFTTYAQGAADYGCYDYLKDIERLESLKKIPPHGKKYKMGFAIIISNYYIYWGNDSNGKRLKSGNSSWENIRLDEGEEKTGKLGLKKPYTGERKNPINLSKKYIMNWIEYPHLCEEVIEKRAKHPIKYMIQEVS